MTHQILRKHQNGRYILTDDNPVGGRIEAEFSCGEGIEVLIGGHWIAGRMEHGTDYCILIYDHDDPDRFTRLDPGSMRARRLDRRAKGTDPIAELIEVAESLLAHAESEHQFYGPSALRRAREVIDKAKGSNQ